MILRFHHAQITIPKGMENEARDFYCRLLGLEEIDKPETLRGRGGFWVQVGEQQLHIGTEEGFNRNQTKAHLAYQVDNLKVIQDLLKSNGVEILDSIPITGFKRFEFRDPFGNRVECIEQII